MSIRFEKVNFTYSPNTPFEKKALEDITVSFSDGSITAVIGNTGSGKSTLVQHLNALLLPTTGRVEVLDFVMENNEKCKSTKELRKKVGLVFQFPEYQLFEDNVLKDVMFGPMNFGTSVLEAQEKSKKALQLVGIDASYYERSPLELSGGEKRKVAIAGILAMEPEIIVLDEPVAGLDPQSARKMMELFQFINQKLNKTIIIVTHNMEHVLSYCQNVVVIKDGRMIHEGSVEEFFTHDEILDDLHIEPPMVIKAKRLLKEKGIKIADDVLKIEELAKAISKVVVK